MTREERRTPSKQIRRREASKEAKKKKTIREICLRNCKK
jgi:hypothetical protein